ncbi:AAA family ATPase [Ruminiclostridium josui]|uniref:AAA family ATPase n=2 Tax=Ruminiclostridium josui TaxID=1499 RepID=UPI0004661F4C|nr:AAA family ATPase [Ruminiclostridium josui]
MNKDLRIAISGTFATGKTTLAVALGELTAVPMISVKSLEEVTSLHFPGKTIDQCSPFEYYQICIYRFLEQVMSEKRVQGNFIVDGTLIESYIYGQVKLNSLNYTPFSFNLFANNLGIITHKNIYENFYKSLGNVFKEYCRRNYHSFIHLPVESTATQEDNHYYSDKVRKTCDEMIISALEEIGIEYYIITGSTEERLKKIMNIYGIKPKNQLL